MGFEKDGHVIISDSSPFCSVNLLGIEMDFFLHRQ